MMSNVLRISTLMMCALQGNCLAQAFVAEGVLKIYKIEDSGSLLERRSFQIVEARDADGNRYTAQIRPQGRLVTLWLKQTNEAYSIDFGAKAIRPLGPMKNPPGLEAVSSMRQMNTQFTSKTLLGATCIALPIYNTTAKGRVKTGEVCISEELGGVALHKSLDWTVKDGTFRNELTITAVQRGMIPDPALFQLPQGFKTVAPRSSAVAKR